MLQCFVYGDSLRNELVAIVVPDPEMLLPWAKERHMSDDLVKLCADPHVNAVRGAQGQEQGGRGARGGHLALDK